MKKLFGLANLKKPLAHLRGQQAEQKARQYLERQGLSFVAQNYRCSAGEIDLIMRCGEEWVFVEVKFRQSANFGSAAEYYTGHKATKVKRAIARYFLSAGYNQEYIAHRIDLVAIDGEQIQWFQAVDI